MLAHSYRLGEKRSDIIVVTTGPSQMLFLFHYNSGVIC